MGVLNPRVDPLANWDAMPISHARIGYQNLLSTAATTDAAKALTPNTYERWRPASGALAVKFQLAASAAVDYIGIAAHDLAGERIVVKYATSIGGALTNLIQIAPSTNAAIMVLLPSPITMAEIELSGTLASASEIGVLHAGRALQMYQPIYGGHAPISLNASTEYQSNDSDSGQFLGRSIVRRGGETSFSWRHLDPDWYRARFQPFVESAKLLPFFIKWRPDLYDEAAYGYSTSDIGGSNMGGGHRLMAASLQMRGHEDV